MIESNSLANQALPSMHTAIAAQPPVQAPPQTHAHNLGLLKPKGACWYCNAPLDNVKRFCNKTCAEDYQTEEEVFR
jgi:hypothetical protein